MNYTLFNEDFLHGVNNIDDDSIDLVIADPPYGLGKDFGNDSDKMNPDEFLEWTKAWVLAVLPKIKDTGSLYIFATWQHSPEIFSFIKTEMVMHSAIFAWLGLVSGHPLGFALVYVFLWEGLLSSFLDGIRYLSVRAYTLTIMEGIDESRLDALGELTIELPAAIAGVVLVSAAFFWLTVRRLRRMDVP